MDMFSYSLLGSMPERSISACKILPVLAFSSLATASRSLCLGVEKNNRTNAVRARRMHAG